MRIDMISLRHLLTAVCPSSSFFNLLLAAGIAISVNPALNAATVTAVRSGDHGDFQRLVFDLQSATGSTSQPPNSANPPKLVRTSLLSYELTLPDTSWGVRGQRLGNADLVHSLKLLTPTKPNQVRIALKLTAAAEVNSRMLSHPNRLLLDLHTGRTRKTAHPKPAAAPPKARSANTATQPPKKNLRVIIDPGHGGRAPGAVGPSGVLEKDVVLAICKQLHQQLNARPGITALLTRKNDRAISLQDRVNIARDSQADLFVSVHADAIHQRSVRGGSVYVLSNVGANKAARRWAGTLNHIPQERRSLAGIDLNNRDATVANVLFDLVQTDTIQRSNQLASDVLSHLSADNEVRFKNIKLAELGVLKAPDIPSILVETAFISNPSDERLLNSRDGQKRLARSIAKGIERFANRATEIARARSRIQQNNYQDYAVTAGDTLFSLARRFNTSVKAIRRANALPDDRLHPGMRLRIPTIAQRVASRG